MQNSDTEVILKAYERWGGDCVSKLEECSLLHCGTKINLIFFVHEIDFGIKPFYYTVVNEVFYCASEIKALLPFVEQIDTDLDSLNDYLTFQFTLG